MRPCKWTHLTDTDDIEAGRDYACVDLEGEHEAEIKGEGKTFKISAKVLLPLDGGEMILLASDVSLKESQDE